MTATTPSNSQDADRLEDHRNRLRWRSRRGMLELELLLLPFVEHWLAGLDADQLDAFDRLLDAEDWDIFNWLQDREPVPPEIADIVAAVRLAQKTPP